MKWQRNHRPFLRLTCLDVGHGQAILAQLPGTANLLFDAGSLYGKDVGARIVVPFLDYAGIGRLHAIIASHHDLDHINGIPEVVDSRGVRRVYLGGAFFTAAPVVQTTELLTGRLAERHTGVEHVPETISTGSASIDVLWPVDASETHEKLGENDRSLVCLIQFAGRRVLLCSDIEKPAQREILKRYPSLQAEVVIAPHHGSVRTLDGDFVQRLGPSVLICSCGQRDYEQGRIVKEAAQAQVLATAKHGAVTVRIDKAGVVEPVALGP